jgi:chromosome partitioning protein
MRVIASLTEKGGTGKTTLAILTAVHAARRGQRVLVIALDYQASAPGRLTPHALPADASGAADLLLGRQPTPLIGIDGIHLLTGGRALDGGDIRALPHDELRARLDDYATRYDVVVLDLAPGAVHLHHQALGAADTALLVADASSVEAAAGTAKMVSEIATAAQRKRAHPRRVAIICNRMPVRGKGTTTLAKQLLASYALHRLPVFPLREANAIPEAAVTRDYLPLFADTPLGIELARIMEWTDG